MPQFVLYCHGFQSSPQSAKALQTRAWFAQHHPQVRLATPQLPVYPDQAKALLEHLLSQYQDWQLGFIGSSLGGYLATWLQQQYGGKAVVINPAVKPFELLEDYQMELVQPYTGEIFQLNRQHMEMLKSLDTPSVKQPDNLWALLQTGDETLDYRQAAEKYQACRVTVEEGGDHGFQGYERHLPQIAEFLLK